MAAWRRQHLDHLQPVGVERPRASGCSPGRTAPAPVRGAGSARTSPSGPCARPRTDRCARAPSRRASSSSTCAWLCSTWSTMPWQSAWLWARGCACSGVALPVADLAQWPRRRTPGRAAAPARRAAPPRSPSRRGSGWPPAAGTGSRWRWPATPSSPRSCPATRPSSPRWSWCVEPPRLEGRGGGRPRRLPRLAVPAPQRAAVGQQEVGLLGRQEPGLGGGAPALVGVEGLEQVAPRPAGGGPCAARTRKACSQAMASTPRNSLARAALMARSYSATASGSCPFSRNSSALTSRW